MSKQNNELILESLKDMQSYADPIRSLISLVLLIAPIAGIFYLLSYTIQEQIPFPVASSSLSTFVLIILLIGLWILVMYLTLFFMPFFFVSTLFEEENNRIFFSKQKSFFMRQLVNFCHYVLLVVVPVVAVFSLLYLDGIALATKKGFLLFFLDHEEIFNIGIILLLVFTLGIYSVLRYEINSALRKSESYIGSFFSLPCFNIIIFMWVFLWVVTVEAYLKNQHIFAPSKIYLLMTALFAMLYPGILLFKKRINKKNNSSITINRAIVFLLFMLILLPFTQLGAGITRTALIILDAGGWKEQVSYYTDANELHLLPIGIAAKNEQGRLITMPVCVLLNDGNNTYVKIPQTGSVVELSDGLFHITQYPQLKKELPLFFRDNGINECG